MKFILSFIATLMLGAAMLSSFTPVYAQLDQAEQTDNGVVYFNGGIGYEEAKQFESMSASYPLWMLFSEGECGRALSNVNLMIENKAKETVFSLDNAGPQLLIDLPKGEYKATAMYQDQAQGARFVIGKGNQKVVLHWKNCVEEDSLDLPEQAE